MINNKFPIGQTLTGVTVIEDKDFGGNELCLEQVKLLFLEQTIILLPISDTDEIKIIKENKVDKYITNSPSWCESFINKKLMTVWVCDNDQGYQDQVIFAFGYLRPSLAFVSEGSVIKVFNYEPIYRVLSDTKLQYNQVLIS
ncbi:DUF6334 family protein [Aphanothece sacrum]|uniref:DUF6334 family protein n=1 Tax=Aphanothece sacrum TaxID=1122 RepID=UPI000F60752B|nr:DUF6334 family protein [Aphanothece sacrum]